jgi:NAD/NADP transhydrogenase beta subunit
MSRSSPKPPLAPSLPQQQGAPSQRQPMTGARLAAAVVAWITLSLLAGGATMLIRSMLAPGLTTDTLAVIIVTEVYVLLVVSLLAASGGWSAAVEAFGLRIRPRDALVGCSSSGHCRSRPCWATP